jgi:hypothetical protein
MQHMLHSLTGMVVDNQPLKEAFMKKCIFTWTVLPFCRQLFLVLCRSFFFQLAVW